LPITEKNNDKQLKKAILPRKATQNILFTYDGTLFPMSCRHCPIHKVLV